MRSLQAAFFGCVLLLAAAPEAMARNIEVAKSANWNVFATITDGIDEFSQCLMEEVSPPAGSVLMFVMRKAQHFTIALSHPDYRFKENQAVEVEMRTDISPASKPSAIAQGPKILFIELGSDPRFLEILRKAKLLVLKIGDLSQEWPLRDTAASIDRLRICARQYEARFPAKASAQQQPAPVAAQGQTSAAPTAIGRPASATAPAAWIAAATAQRPQQRLEALEVTVNIASAAQWTGLRLRSGTVILAPEHVHDVFWETDTVIGETDVVEGPRLGVSELATRYFGYAQSCSEQLTVTVSPTEWVDNIARSYLRFACGTGDDVFVTHRIMAHRKAGGIYSILYHLKDEKAHKDAGNAEIEKAAYWHMTERSKITGEPAAGPRARAQQAREALELMMDVAGPANLPGLQAIYYPNVLKAAGDPDAMWAAQAILGKVHVLDYTTPPQATYTMEQWDSLFVLEANKDCDKGFAAERQRVSFNGADGLLSVTRCERSAGLPILTVRNTVPRKGGGFYHVDFWPDLRANLTLDQADALIRDLRGKVMEVMLAR